VRAVLAELGRRRAREPVRGVTSGPWTRTPWRLYAFVRVPQRLRLASPAVLQVAGPGLLLAADPVQQLFRARGHVHRIEARRHEAKTGRYPLAD